MVTCPGWGVDGAGSDVGEGLEERLAEGKANCFPWLIQGCLPSPKKGFEAMQGRLWMEGMRPAGLGGTGHCAFPALRAEGREPFPAFPFIWAQAGAASHGADGESTREYPVFLRLTGREGISFRNGENFLSRQGLKLQIFSEKLPASLPQTRTNIGYIWDYFSIIVNISVILFRITFVTLCAGIAGV